MTLLIKNGHIVTASDDYTADILVEEGRIRAIGLDLPVGGHAELHDAAGLLVLPGGVDPHTHLDWDFGVARTADTFGSGTKAASPPRTGGRCRKLLRTGTIARRRPRSTWPPI